ncbi:MAG: lipocalin-like domain-containing protein [Flavobacteriia bacterium]|nr:lipocalin-like domain-containing protein [Flavobacteriia bacterium]
MRQIIVICYAILVAISCTEEKSDSTLPIVGMWELLEMNLVDSTGAESPFKGGMQGLLVYSEDGHVALHLSYSDYQNTALKIRNFTDTLTREKLEYLTGTYHYMGDYEVLEMNSEDGKLTGTVQHTRRVHSNPNDWGKVVQRSFEYRNDTLRMRPVEAVNSGIRLTWVRMKKE